MANKKYTYDYIIIGSGAAGATVALSLASPKRKVAIVEGDIFGGSNLVTRDVPYAISLSFASMIARFCGVTSVRTTANSSPPIRQT